MAIPGEIKENFLGLHLSTGESFAHMAERIMAPEVLQHLDKRAQEANAELAEWLKAQTDDPEVRDRMVDQPIKERQEQDAALQRAAAGSVTQPPAGRTSSSGKGNA